MDGEAQPRPRAGDRKFLLLFALLLLLIALYVAWPYRGPILFSGLLALLLHPVHIALSRRLKRPRLAAALVLVIAAILLVAPFLLVGASLVDDARAVAEFVATGRVEEMAGAMVMELGLPGRYVQPVLAEATSVVSGALEAFLLGAVRAAAGLVVNLVVFFFLLYFFLVDGPAAIAYARRVVPLRDDRRERLLARISQNVRAILVGTLLVGVVQGIIAGAGWWLLGFPQPVFWGFVMTLLGVLPFAGPFLVILPAAGVAIYQGNVGGGIGLFIFGVVLAGLVDDALRPYFIGKRSGVHPAVVLVGILGGTAVFGLSGFVIGPLLLSLAWPVIAEWAQPWEEAI